MPLSELLVQHCNLILDGLGLVVLVLEGVPAQHSTAQGMARRGGAQRAAEHAVQQSTLGMVDVVLHRLGWDYTARWSD